MRNNANLKILLSYGIMRKKLLFSLIVGLAWFHVASVYSSCSSSPCGGDKTWINSKPITPGCETLQVTMQNNTEFSFVKDSSYNPDHTIGNTANFDDIAAHDTKTFSIQGVSNPNDASQQDEVDTSIRYIAKHKISATGPYDENTGAGFTVTLKKSSCNSSAPSLKMDDHECYSASRLCEVDCNYKNCSHCYWGPCIFGGFECAGGNHVCMTNFDSRCSSPVKTPDGMCVDEYDTFQSLDCKTASTDPSVGAILAHASAVALTSGLYSVGVKTAADGTLSSTEDPTVKSSTYSNFTCNQSSECGGESCGGGTSDYNKPAQLVFHVYPARIETLTVTFPFNTQTPIAKILKDSIYNNLSSKYLSQLGTYFSYQPVVVTDKTIAFSTLCNSANCP